MTRRLYGNAGFQAGERIHREFRLWRPPRANREGINARGRSVKAVLINILYK